MKYRNSRGGAKPSMLRGEATPIPVHTTEGVRKEGLYQVGMEKIGKKNNKRVLARMVELPTWLTDTVNQLKLANQPLQGYLLSEDIQDSRSSDESWGHILLDPQNVQISCNEPLVGVDVEVFEKITSLNVESITFHVFTETYKRIERWRITLDEFKQQCVEVDSSEGFSKQYMVPVSSLQRYANN